MTQPPLASPLPSDIEVAQQVGSGGGSRRTWRRAPEQAALRLQSWCMAGPSPRPPHTAPARGGGARRCSWRPSLFDLFPPCRFTDTRKETVSPGSIVVASARDAQALVAPAPRTTKPSAVGSIVLPRLARGVCLERRSESEGPRAEPAGLKTRPGCPRSTRRRA